MSREIRRVPMDLNAPIGETWQGYVMPDHLRLPKCPACQGRGSTPAADWLSRIMELLMTAAEESLRNRPQGLHPYLAQMCNRPSRDPSPDMVELTTGLSGRPMGPFGHDSSDGWIAARKVVEAAGLDPEEWGFCPGCHGAGHVATPEQRAARDAWKSYEPPTGPGWQYWETVTEGSPQSPVFASADELVTFLVRHENYRLSAARQLVEDGSTAGSGMIITTPERHVTDLDSARDADIIASILTPED